MIAEGVVVSRGPNDVGEVFLWDVGHRKRKSDRDGALKGGDALWGGTKCMAKSKLGPNLGSGFKVAACHVGIELCLVCQAHNEGALHEAGRVKAHGVPGTRLHDHCNTQKLLLTTRAKQAAEADVKGVGEAHKIWRIICTIRCSAGSDGRDGEGWRCRQGEWVRVREWFADEAVKAERHSAATSVIRQARAATYGPHQVSLFFF